MLFSVSTIAIIGVIYMMTFLGLAWLADRKYIPGNIAGHPVIYVLSLGASTGSWALFGSVGLAYELGNSFLIFYVGLVCLFALTPVILKPLITISKTWQLTSLADLFTFRFHSSLVGSLTTCMVFFAILPLLALQIRAVTNVIEIMSCPESCTGIAGAFSALVTIFILLFGIRRNNNRKAHSGFMFAIAAQSLLKLICILTISAIIFFQVFDDLPQLIKWVTGPQNKISTINKTLQNGPWQILMPAFIMTSLTMPHIFYLLFTHKHKKSSLNMARWAMPLLFLVTSLTTPIIFWASLKFNTIAVMQSEFSILQIGTELNSSLLIIITFLAAICASCCLLSLTVLSLSSMIMNHLVLPFARRPQKINLYSWLQWIKRMLVPSIMLAAYGTYDILPEKNNLSHLALVSFSAMMQFLPGLLATLYFKKANRFGFITGVIGGMLVWLLSMLLPTLLGQHSYIGSNWINFTIYDSNLHWISLASVLINITLFYGVSLTTKTSEKEKQRAILCSNDQQEFNHYLTQNKASLPELEKRLGSFIGAPAAHREVNKALYELNFSHTEKRTFAIEQFKNQLESNLCGLLGPSVTQDIISTCFPPHSEELKQDLHFLECKLSAYHCKLTGLAGELDKLRRFHRNTLQSLPIAVCLLNYKDEVLLWNRAMERLTCIRSSHITGSDTADLSLPWRAFIQSFKQNELSRQLKRRLIVKDEARWFNLQKAHVIIPENTFSTEYKDRMFSTIDPEHNSVIILIEEVTETKRLEEQLVHNERLASIGQMAAGVAHEIGNPVTGIDCLAQELKNFSESEDTKEVADQILQQTQRISKILQSLVNFSHGGHTVLSKETKNVINLKRCCNEAIALLSLSSENRNVRFENRCNKEIFVIGDEQKLTQIFLNLLGNAADAITSHDSQSAPIIIETHSDQKTVDLIITDEGPGISENVKDRIFEPFVTTKEVGKGTGLGLALVYSIVKEHNGSIKVKSPVEPLKQAAGKGGCQFSITLPVYIQQDKLNTKSHEFSTQRTDGKNFCLKLYRFE